MEGTKGQYVAGEMKEGSLLGGTHESLGRPRSMKEVGPPPWGGENFDAVLTRIGPGGRGVRIRGWRGVSTSLSPSAYEQRDTRNLKTGKKNTTTCLLRKKGGCSERKPEKKTQHGSMNSGNDKLQKNFLDGSEKRPRGTKTWA